MEWSLFQLRILKRQCAVYEAVQIRMFTYVIINCVMGTRKSAFFCSTNVAKMDSHACSHESDSELDPERYESEQVIFRCALI